MSTLRAFCIVLYRSEETLSPSSDRIQEIVEDCAERVDLLGGARKFASLGLGVAQSILRFCTLCLGRCSELLRCSHLLSLGIGSRRLLYWFAAGRWVE